MRSTIQYINSELDGLYPVTEITSLAGLIIEVVYDLSYTDQVLFKDKKLPKNQLEKVTQIVNRLKNFEPIQYILGETVFYGLHLKVAEGVLIPRPETEELVHRIIKLELYPQSRILDIGTGSGCIALSLKKAYPQAEIEGIDVSEKALSTARENAGINQLDVQFKLQDILKWQETKWDEYNVIVSNPPYVRELEKQAMNPNVLNYEPAAALFVSDQDPLIFYRIIAEFARVNLKDRGYLFFEINEYLGNETCALLKDYGFKDVELFKDLDNKDRMVACQK